MSPHMRGDDGLVFALMLLAPMIFAACGGLSLIALLFRGHVARIAQWLSLVGVVLMHLMMLASRHYLEIISIWDLGPFFWMTLLGHLLVVAGHFRVRALRASPA